MMSIMIKTTKFSIKHCNFAKEPQSHLILNKEVNIKQKAFLMIKK